MGLEALNPNPEPDTTSVSLLKRVRDGEAEAWERLVQLYSPLIFSRCRSMGLEPEQAGDVVQEVFRSVYAKIGEFRRDRPGDGFRRWLRTVARNAAIDYFRVEGRQAQPQGGSKVHAQLQQVPDPVVDEDTLAASESDMQLLMRRALELLENEFEKRTWQAFWRTAVEDEKAVDVARDLEMSAGTVRNARYKVMSRLRAEFGELLE